MLELKVFSGFKIGCVELSFFQFYNRVVEVSPTSWNLSRLKNFCSAVSFVEFSG